ncbi:MAG: DUF1269 domain-containing protein [Anaerolineales bacterium]
MNEMTGYEVFVAAYADESGAHKALHTLEEMDKSGSIEIIDAALIAKDMQGKISVVETAELTPKKGAGKGAIVGVVLGVIFPPSIIAGAVLGGTVGALVGKFTDKGLFDNTALKEAAEDLPEGSSAIVAVVEDKWVQQMATAIEGYNKLANNALDAEFAADLMVVGEAA